MMLKQITTKVLNLLRRLVRLGKTASSKTPTPVFPQGNHTETDGGIVDGNDKSGRGTILRDRHQSEGYDHLDEPRDPRHDEESALLAEYNKSVSTAAANQPNDTEPLVDEANKSSQTFTSAGETEAKSPKMPQNGSRTESLDPVVDHSSADTRELTDVELVESKAIIQSDSALTKETELSTPNTDQGEASAADASDLSPDLKSKTNNSAVADVGSISTEVDPRLVTPAKSGEDDHKHMSYSQNGAEAQDGSLEAPVDQPTPNDDESSEFALEPSIQSSDGSEKTPSDLPKDASGKSDSPPTESSENHSDASLSNAVNDTSQPDSTDLPPEPQKISKPPEGSPVDGNSESTEGKSGKKQPKPKSPREIGGRRNRAARLNPSSTTAPKDKSTFTPQPELTCRKVSGVWQLVLSADDARNIVEVQWNGERLNIVNGECRLSSFAGRLSIALEDGGHDEFPLFAGTPLIFKLRRNWSGDGRKVGGISRGYFILIAPKEWTRTGRVPVEPESCEDQDFVAHYCFRDQSLEGEEVEGFEECDVVLTKSGFELKGNRVFDNSEAGELFVCKAPELSLPPSVKWARIGEEKVNGWGETFEPAKQSLEEVLKGRQGRFFVRVYDKGATLLDSGEFRYFVNLREIRVNGAPFTETTLLIPPSLGHSPTELQFVGTGGGLVRPKLETESPRVTVRQDGTVVVEPDPNGDSMSCILESGNDGVRVDITLPRIWWRIGQGDGEHEEWRDTPLLMTRREFRTHADADEMIQLRLARIGSINVGFDEELDRRYRSGKGGQEVEISLTDFVDYSQIDRRLNEDTLLNVRCGGLVLTLIRVSADPAPTIDSFTCEPAAINVGETTTLHWETRNTDPDGIFIDPRIGPMESSGSLTVEPNETATFTLRLKAFDMDDVTQDVTVAVRTQPSNPLPIVKCRNGEYRRGKGFSRGELRAAGLKVPDTVRRSIPVDRRRKSRHQVNIDEIEKWADA